MKVLIIGSGGREHALAWKCAQSSRVKQVYVARGNAGTGNEPRVRNVSLTDTDLDALRDFAKEESIDLTIVGPEAPLAAGIVDLFEADGLRIFGPRAAAAQLEGSKAFAKDFMQRHGIPTAAYATFDAIGPALDYVDAHAGKLVVKADGLAAGKGVVVARTRREANDAVKQMMSERAFGDAGQRVVIEELLEGEEASFIAVVGGGKVLPLATSQDHKPVNDGDNGPNTGGMGAYSPAPVVDEACHARIMREVIEPAVKGLEADGLPYTGFLYAGLMIDSSGAPKVLEFNCRSGDPETQPIMHRLRSDLIDICDSAIDGTLDTLEVEWDERAALAVVMTSFGYPSDYRSGDRISGLKLEPPGTKVFHGGTRRVGDDVLTAGGRVLSVCALGETISEAKSVAYNRAGTIDWAGAYCRSDIGYRAIAR